MANEVWPTTDKVTIVREPIKTPPAPHIVRIYAKDGSSIEVFPIDAKEAVAGGEYSYDPPTSTEAETPVAETPEPIAPEDFESMTKAQLQKYGDEHGTHLPQTMSKADMIKALSAEAD